MNAFKYCSFCEAKVNIPYSELETIGWRFLRESGSGVWTTVAVACPQHLSHFDEVVGLRERWRKVARLELLPWWDFLAGAGWMLSDSGLKDGYGRAWLLWPKFRRNESEVL